MINCYSGVATSKERPIGEQEVGFGPDGALEEGEEDVRNGLNGAEVEGVATTVHSRVEGEGAGLALREVGWADTSSGSRFQQMVASVSAGEGVEIYRNLCFATHQEPRLRPSMSRQGILMGMMPSSTRFRETEAPSGRGSLRVIWTARVTLAPFWTRMGKGSTLMLSMEAGSGLPSEKRGFDFGSRTHRRIHTQSQLGELQGRSATCSDQKLRLRR